MAVFGDGSPHPPKKVIKVNWVYKGGSNSGSVL